MTNKSLWEDNPKIHHFQEVTSTMDIARDLARQGCPDFTVVVAERQNTGRGRLKRAWQSSEGGLWFTIVLRPDIPPEMSFRINFSVSLTLALTLRRLFGIDARLKWPNDILVDEQKIVGILSEMEMDDDKVSFVNIGIGINVNNDPPPEVPNASSLKKILGKDIPKEDVLFAFLDAFESHMRCDNAEGVISEWKKYTITLNRHVRVVTTQEETEGLATDVDADGALLVRLDDGTVKKLVYGDCFL